MGSTRRRERACPPRRAPCVTRVDVVGGADVVVMTNSFVPGSLLTESEPRVVGVDVAQDPLRITAEDDGLRVVHDRDRPWHELRRALVDIARVDVFLKPGDALVFHGWGVLGRRESQLRLVV